MSDGNIDRGDVYWVDIPPAHTVGVEQNKKRPFVVMSRNSVHNGLLVIGVPLTTKVAKACAYRILVPAAEIIKDPTYTGSPPQNSVALTDQIRALSTSRFRQRMGRLTDSAMISVGLGISYILDL